MALQHYIGGYVRENIFSNRAESRREGTPFEKFSCSTQKISTRQVKNGFLEFDRKTVVASFLFLEDSYAHVFLFSIHYTNITILVVLMTLFYK